MTEPRSHRTGADCEREGCAACLLAEKTGRPHSDFGAAGYEIPDFREQELIEE